MLSARHARHGNIWKLGAISASFRRHAPPNRHPQPDIFRTHIRHVHPRPRQVRCNRHNGSIPAIKIHPASASHSQSLHALQSSQHSSQSHRRKRTNSTAFPQEKQPAFTKPTYPNAQTPKTKTRSRRVLGDLQLPSYSCVLD